MFCSNCGNKVAEGSKFCSACGARIVAPEAPAAPVEQAESGFKAFSGEAAERPANVKKPSVSFDWSNVKEEPHKKAVPEVVSPWGKTTGLTEEDVEPEVKPANNNSRTMSFIEVIQREREEKALAAQELAREVTERQEAPKDYSIFEDAPKAEPKPEYYIPPMYEVPATPAEPVAPQPSVFEEPVFEEPVFEEPKFEEPKYSEPAFEAPAPKHEAYSEPAFEAPQTASVEDAYVDPSYIEPALEVEDYLNDEPAEPVSPAEEFVEEAPVEEEYVEDASASLDAQLAAILAAGAGKTSASQEEPAEEPAEKPLADEYLAMDEFAAEEPVVESVIAPVKGETEPEEITLEDLAAPAFAEEPEFEELGAPAVETKEPVVFEEAEPEEKEPVIVPEAVVAPAPVVEEAVPVTDQKDAEIEQLKRRLAELMGESVPAEEPVVLKAPAVEEVAPVATAVAPAVQEVVPVVKEVAPVVQEVAPVVQEVAPVVQEVAPAVQEVAPVVQEVTPVVEEPAAPAVSDAMSAEDLERDLFGEVVEVPAEAEATKKIDKFYTLYKKNEEFQRLLDEEYNKLKSGDDVVPTVESVIGTAPAVEEPVVVAEAPAAPVVEEAAPSLEDALEIPAAAAVPVVKAPAVEASPIEEVADGLIAKEEVIEDKQTGKGGTVLTIIAVLIAVLLVILLAVILVLNFAPDSGIAMKLDSVIETIGSYFSVVDITDTFRI